MIGSVAETQDGKIGVIYTIDVNIGSNRPINYKGIGINGKSWESDCPKIIAKSIEEYIDKFVLHKKIREEELLLI